MCHINSCGLISHDAPLSQFLQVKEALTIFDCLQPDGSPVNAIYIAYVGPTNHYTAHPFNV